MQCQLNFPQVSNFSRLIFQKKELIMNPLNQGNQFLLINNFNTKHHKFKPIRHLKGPFNKINMGDKAEIFLDLQVKWRDLN